MGSECPHCERKAQGMSRRNALKTMAGIAAAPLAALIGWPLIQAVVGNIFRLNEEGYVRIADLSSLLVGEPQQISFRQWTSDAYVRKRTIRTVFVVKHSDTEATVLSPVCPHLGCHYDWHSLAEKFICPCHGSVFSVNGKVLGGPAPRPLDTLPCKIEDGALYVKWELFQVGVAEKIRVS
jgi:quinol---cytochrome c reductase iron-sulfur subunit, bacillus type